MIIPGPEEQGDGGEELHVDNSLFSDTGESTAGNSSVMLKWCWFRYCFVLMRYSEKEARLLSLYFKTQAYAALK